VDRRAQDLVTRFNGNFLEKFRRPLLERRAFPKQLTFHTTEDALRVVCCQANEDQLAALDFPRRASAEAVMSVRVHESLANNAAQSLLAGQTLQEEDVRKAALDVLGEVPERLQPKADEPPWSITFERQRPITVELDGNQARVTLRGREFRSEDRSIERMVISAAYRLALGPGGIQATREGEIEVLPAEVASGEGRRVISPAEAPLVTKLKRRFENVFEPELVSEGLELPGKWEKAGRLKLVHVSAEKGWLSLDWDQESQDSNQTAAVRDSRESR
jgi:hypothetical protein